MPISVENHKFFIPVYFVTKLKGFHLELGTGPRGEGGSEKRVMRLPGRERSLTISLAV